jgi:flagellin
MDVWAGTGRFLPDIFKIKEEIFMVIQHNIAAINSYRNLGTNQSALNKNLEKLSSGYKINRAGDNAAGLAISESMRSQINGLNQAAANANDAIGLIQTAEGALTEVHSMLQRMTTLATQAANGTYNSVARGNIQSEMNELMAEIDRVANNTDFNGIKPLESKNGYDAASRTGNSHKMTFQIGPTAGETILVSGQSMTISGIFNATSATYANGMTNKTVDENHILWVGTTTTTYANRAITAIKSAIDTVSSYRAKLGAAQNRLEHTISNLEVTSENITAAESRIRDTDMADEITNYTKNNILLQAAQSMLSQANAAPQGVLSLLQ